MAIPLGTLPKIVLGVWVFYAPENERMSPEFLNGCWFRWFILQNWVLALLYGGGKKNNSFIFGGEGVLLTYPPQTEIRVYNSRPHLRETNG